MKFNRIELRWFNQSFSSFFFFLIIAVDHPVDHDRDPTREHLPAVAVAARVPTQRRQRRLRRDPAHVPRRDRGCALGHSRRVQCPAAAQAVDRQVTRTRHRGRRRSRRHRRAVPDRDRRAHPDGHDHGIGSPIPLDCTRRRHHSAPAQSDTSEEAMVTIFLHRRLH